MNPNSPALLAHRCRTVIMISRTTLFVLRAIMDDFWIKKSSFPARTRFQTIVAQQAYFLLFAALPAFFAPGAVSAAQRPNVIVILTDDQGWGDLSLNGNTNLSTPNVDSLARDGASFDRFYVCPVCSPTRAEFLTGRYHPRSGVRHTSQGGERMDLDEVTIADTFKAAGYATAAFGKWHNGAQYPYHPNGRGFDEFYGFCSGHWGDYFSPPLDHNGQLVTGQGFTTDDFTDHAIQFVEHQHVVRGSPDHAQGGTVGRPATTRRPFFAFVAFNTPHSPMQVPDRWWNRFKGKELKLRGSQPEREKIVHTRAALAMCENVDWNVGRILERLDELDISDDTIVVYFCDNGPNGDRWNGGLRGIKATTDEGGVRSPMLIRWPSKIDGSKKVPQIAGVIDLLPTLAALAEVPLVGKKPLDGVSLKPLLVDVAPDKNSPSTAMRKALDDRMIFSHWNDKVSVCSGHFRLTENGKLYNVLADPGQRNDLSQRRPKIKARLAAAVADWRNNVLSEMEPDDRPFIVGHPGAKSTYLSAGEAVPHGNIQRSNRHPNSSFLTNWTSVDDRIAWDVEVAESGNYDVEMFYTCPAADVGSMIELSFKDSRLQGKITKAHDPPLRGAEHDRFPRGESYVKSFRPLKPGTIRLEKGRGELSLRAVKISGTNVIDVSMLSLRRAME